ncbi:MAG: MurR/RpiR family transcriptional regulator [Pseudomonadota bacterium]
MQHVLAHLRQQLPTLSPKLQQAGKLVLDKPAAVVTQSMREFAREAGVTPPTLERLANALNYASYAALKTSFLSAFNDFDFEQRANQLQTTTELKGGAAVINELQQAAHSNVDFFFRNLDEDSINRAADLMINAKTVYVIAASAPHWMAAYLQYVGKMAVPSMRVPRTAGDGLLDGLIPLTSDDVVLAMSYNPYAKQTVEAIDFALQRQAALIYLTDSVAAPRADKASVLIRQSTDSPQFFPSMIGVAAAIETLLAVTVARSGQETVKAIATYAELRKSRYVNF